MIIVFGIYDLILYIERKYNMKNQDYYLRTNGYFWTMTPSLFDASNVYALVYGVNPAGELNNWKNVTNSNGVRADSY